MTEREAVVVTRERDPIAVAKLVTQLRALEVVAEWHYRRDSERNDPQWSSGYLTPPNATAPEIVVSNEELGESDRDDLLALCDKRGIDAPARAILVASVWRYEVDGTGDGDDLERLFAATALAIAESRQGIIIVRKPWRVYTPAEYRALIGSAGR